MASGERYAKESETAPECRSSEADEVVEQELTKLITNRTKSL